MVQSSMKPWLKPYILEKIKKTSINKIESFHYVLSNIIQFINQFDYSIALFRSISVFISN